MSWGAMNGTMGRIERTNVDNLGVGGIVASTVDLAPVGGPRLGVARVGMRPMGKRDKPALSVVDGRCSNEATVRKDEKV